MLGLPVSYLLIISVLSTSVVSLTNAMFSKKIKPSSTELWFFTMVQSFCTGTLIFVIMGGIDKLHLFSVISGIMLGIIVVLQFKSYLTALSAGPFAYTVVIISLSAIIPTLSGLFWGEKITILQCVGIVLMAVCIILSPERGNKSNKKAGLKWLLISLLASFLNGMVGVMQKIHQTSAYSEEKAAFLVIAFLTATVISIIFYLLAPKNGDTKEKLRIPAKKYIYFAMPVISGIGFALPHTVNLRLVELLPTAVMFPLVNLLPMILSTIFATALFREKLTMLRWFGIAIGLVSAILVAGVIKV